MHDKECWQQQLSDLITDPKELLSLLALDESLLGEALSAAKLFPLRIPRIFLTRIEKGNPNDPLLKQILPLGLELVDLPGYTEDPLQEKAVNPVPGVLHKYHGRALITLTGVCAIHCRYCFRRHFPYQANNPGTSGWEAIFSYLRQDVTIQEVILSGGDPLAVSDKLLQSFIEQLAQIPSIKRLRIHTRLPVIIPNRVTDKLIQLLVSQTHLTPIIVLHINHPNEIDATVERAFQYFRKSRICLLNQSVLLKGVNDTKEILIALSEKLFSVGILPYYLHILDKVKGASHFDLPSVQAVALHETITKYLPGYLVPRLVNEQAGAPSKIVLARHCERSEVTHGAL